jgi:hypothetical protein
MSTRGSCSPESSSMIVCLMASVLLCAWTRTSIHMHWVGNAVRGKAAIRMRVSRLCPRSPGASRSHLAEPQRPSPCERERCNSVLMWPPSLWRALCLSLRVCVVCINRGCFCTRDVYMKAHSQRFLRSSKLHKAAHGDIGEEAREVRGKVCT